MDMTSIVSTDEALRIARFPEHQTVLHGEFVAGEGAGFEVVYPATGELLIEAKASSLNQVRGAVAAARTAFGAWSQTPAAERAAILNAAADAMVEDTDRLAHLVTLDNGKTLAEARLDVVASVGLVRSAAGWATRLKGETLPPGDGVFELTWREAIGVIAIFMPFNAPLMFSGMKVAAALAMGNTVVVKAPEKSPIAAVAFAEYLHFAGLPAGVVNIVQGFGDVGQELAGAGDVDMVSFTGSSKVGALVGTAAVQNFKRVVLELGGKSANIIYDDAPFDNAVEASLGAIFRNAGQRCFSGSRILVQEGIADRFMEALVRRTGELVVGDPFDPNTNLGSLIAEEDVKRVRGLVSRAQEQGGRLLCGGDAPAGAPAHSGFFLPTIIDVGDRRDLEILQEEVFGPVVTVQRFKDLDDAVGIANDSRYGLAGGCWTTNVATAMATARRVNAGYFWINAYGSSAGPESSIGGRRKSGFGLEKGQAGALEYTVQKSVVISADPTGKATPMMGNRE